MEFAEELEEVEKDIPAIIPEIEAMRELFRRAYYGTSFTPDVRAETCVLDFSKELADDLMTLGERSGNYKDKYINYLRQWAGRKSRCMSSMITGPANFPVASNQKRLDAERRIWDEFQKWRDRYMKSAFSEPTLSPVDDLVVAEKELEKQKSAHRMMLGINRIVRKKISDDEKRKLISDEYKLSDATIKKIMEPYLGVSGFHGFELTNSNARIKRLEEKIAVMKTRINRKETFEKIDFPGGSIDIENDRVVIYHDTKPEREVIDALKRHGFRWSPRFKCWCRKHTGNAIHDAKKICGIQ
ncbi:MAG TPA: hypothetical protein PKL77_07345 [Candidatus Omnitrophota bacterium]|nr:hypothetical protein [Candidatus Omnitrophota bacterium]